MYVNKFYIKNVMIGVRFLGILMYTVMKKMLLIYRNFSRKH